MADNFLTIEQIHLYLLQNGGKVKNRDAVRHFKGYLTDPLTKDENRSRFKSYVNTLALSKTEGDDKIIQLKPKYSGYDPSQRPAEAPINSVGLPPPEAAAPRRTPPRPPPYRPPPPPPPVYSSTTSLDALSLGSVMSLNEPPPQPPPPPGDRRRDSADGGDGNGEDKTVSVKERTQKFNRLASVEDPLSPKQATKSPEKDARRIGRGLEPDDDLNQPPLEPKKCVEWYVTASKGDYQELLKLASSEPRLVNKKDPFTATVLHWGAKYGNDEIIKTFAGKYKVDVNGKTNGGYTPLHISAQFGHKNVFKLLIEVYKADPNVRDYSGRRADYYLLAKEQKENRIVTMRKIKGRKKQSDKEGFLRIGSLNVRVKKTTEAFSNFLGVGGGANVTPLDPVNEKTLKGWGSVDNVNNKEGSLKANGSKKKWKKGSESGSTPSTPKTTAKIFNAHNCNDSDSDTAAGFDSTWKHVK